MIRITDTIAIGEDEISERFIHAAGPGGQNVNKVASAVQLRFDVAGSPTLPEDVRLRLIRLAGRRATRSGVLVITAQRFRTQERNREDAIERLIALIQQAAVRPLKRRPTRPTAASRERRLATKKRHAGVKSLRGVPPAEEERPETTKGAARRRAPAGNDYLHIEISIWKDIADRSDSLYL